MLKKIQEIDGIGSEDAKLLLKVGINTSHLLLLIGGNRSGRKLLSEKTSIKEENILKWVNLCDLYRIGGINSQIVVLLKLAGIDTVRELRSRKPKELTAKLSEINYIQKICNVPPTIMAVRKWIEQAKMITPRVFH